MTELDAEFEELITEKIIKGVTANLANLFGIEVPVKTPKEEKKAKSDLKKEPEKLKYQFSEVLYDSSKIKSKEEREDTEWIEKVSYFLRLFKEYGEPITIHPSKKYDENPNMKPMTMTVFPKSVDTVASDLHLLLQKNAGERTWHHDLIFGLSIPSASDREEATRYMRGALGLKCTSKTFSKKLLSLLKEAGGDLEAKDTRKDIGEAYEQQLEYHFYMNGFHVYHNGLKEQYNDKGVDLILVKNGETYLVQAKCWKNKKLTPHDVEMIYHKMSDWYNNNKDSNKEVVGALRTLILVVSNEECIPSETKQKCDELGLTCATVPFKEEWKSAKCVIARNGDKIYYGPEHGAWKKLDMHSDKRRFWATVDEAKEKGYRVPGIKKK